MPKVSLNAQAPDFTLINFEEQPISLTDFKGEKQVLLVFNRGFV